MSDPQGGSAETPADHDPQRTARIDRAHRQLAMLADVEAQLTSPGGFFALEKATVLGEEIDVFASRQRSIRDLIEHSASHGDNEFMVFDDGRRFSFADHIDRVAATAKALANNYGVAQGSRVAIFAANSAEYVFLHHAAVSLGAVTVAMNGWWTADEVAHALSQTEPVVLFTDDKRGARLTDLTVSCPVVDLSTEARTMADAHLGTTLPSQPIAEDDPAVILFTSGTTGRPKAALLSHRVLIGFSHSAMYLGARSAMLNAATAPPPDPDAGPAPEPPPAVRLAPFPLFHVSGMFSSLLMPLFAGYKTVWPTGRFDPEAIFALVDTEGITAISGAATHIWRLLDHPGFSAERMAGVSDIGMGGSATTPELIRHTESLMPWTRDTFSTGYGQTENGAMVAGATNAMLALDPECVGPPVAGVSVRIVDDEGNEVADGIDGNIWVRSALVMLEYVNNPEATAEALQPGRWLVTGDVGRMNNGMLHIASRKRDLIIRGGENIHPGEIENALEAHPDISEVAVFGVDHRELGEEVKAVVVPRGDAVVDTDAVAASLADTLAYYKVPTLWEVRTEPMPRNAAGKILKHVLRGDAENTFIDE